MDDTTSIEVAPAAQPYDEWHAELKEIAGVVKKARSKTKPNLTEARAKLASLHQRTREHAADISSAFARVGEAMLLQHEATVEKVAKRHLHEAHCYERAAALWIEIEAERYAINESSLGEALYNALICTAMACSALVADASQNGDITLSVDAATYDSAEIERLAKELLRNANKDSSSPASAPASQTSLAEVTPSSPDATSSTATDAAAPAPEEQAANSLSNKAGRFFGALRSKIKETIKSTNTSTAASNPTAGSSSGGATASSSDAATATANRMAEFEAQVREASMAPSGRPWLPRFAKPHNFRHSTRVHGLLSSMSQRLALYGCCEVAADLLLLAAEFLVDETPGFAKAQADEIAAAQKRSVVTGEDGTKSPRSAPAAAPSPLPEGALPLGRCSVSPGSNGSLLGNAGYLPACRVALKNLSKFIDSSRRAVALLLALQHYDRASIVAHDALALLQPLLEHHRQALLKGAASATVEPTAVARQRRVPSSVAAGLSRLHDPSGTLWYAGPLSTADEKSNAALYDSTTGRRLPDYSLIRLGGYPLAGGAPIFGAVESANVSLLCVSRIVAAILSKAPSQVVDELIASFETLPTNLHKRPGDGKLVLRPRAKAIHALLDTVCAAGSQYATVEAAASGPMCVDHGVELPQGPTTFAAAVRNATAALVEQCAAPLADPYFLLALQRVPDVLTWDPLHRYLSSKPVVTAPSSPSPARNATTAAAGSTAAAVITASAFDTASPLVPIDDGPRASVYVDPADLSP